MKFKVGQRVYCSYKKKYGVVAIVAEKDVDRVVPIVVAFSNGQGLYSEDGRFFGFGGITLSIPLKDKLNKLLKL